MRVSLRRTQPVVFDGEGITHAYVTELEATALDLRREGVTFVFARLKEGVRVRFAESGLTEAVGAERFYPTVRAAVEACIEPRPNNIGNDSATSREGGP